MNEGRPNILWYCTDQQRFDTIGALGNPHVRTPTIDRLVRRGVAMTHVYCQSPICTPSRAAFMTGMYPSRIHCTRNGNESFLPWPPVVTRLIADSGYECGLVGKFHLQSAGQRIEPRIDDGFDYWRFSHAPRDDWPTGHDYADWVRANGADLDALRNSDEHVPPPLHQTTWASDMAIEFIGRPHDRPWLLNVNVYDPHPPFIPPRAYFERFDSRQMPGPHFRESDLAHQVRLRQIDFQGQVKRPEDRQAKTIQAKYYAMIAQIDDQLARILDVLETTGQLDRTVVIFTSDHGETLGDHGLLEKGCRFYEGLVRVPLIFHWPGHLEENLQSPALVELIDKTATILELAGLEVPPHMQGRSVLSILRGAAPPEVHREFVRCEYFDALDTSFTGGTGAFATMYRDQRYKLTVYHGHDLGELYDLEKDPWEFDDLWDDPDHHWLKSELIHKSFDATMLMTTDVGSRRIAPM